MERSGSGVLSTFSGPIHILNVVRRPLHGIPFLAKDTFVTMDKKETTGQGYPLLDVATPSSATILKITGGSYTLIGARYGSESTVLTKLRESGAIILGKANLSEWAMARPPKCNNEWSALYGPALAAFHEGQEARIPKGRHLVALLQ